MMRTMNQGQQPRQCLLGMIHFTLLMLVTPRWYAARASKISPTTCVLIIDLVIFNSFDLIQAKARFTLGVAVVLSSFGPSVFK